MNKESYQKVEKASAAVARGLKKTLAFLPEIGRRFKKGFTEGWEEEKQAALKRIAAVEGSNTTNKHQSP